MLPAPVSPPAPHLPMTPAAPGPERTGGKPRRVRVGRVRVEGCPIVTFPRAAALLRTRGVAGGGFPLPAFARTGSAGTT